MATEDRFQEVVEKGKIYHNLIADFVKKHPDVSKALESEDDYLAYTMLKVANRNPTFGIMLDLLPDGMSSFQDALICAFTQGYYRAYQQLQLDKLEGK